jgi:hypothetical protein
VHKCQVQCNPSGAGVSLRGQCVPAQSNYTLPGTSAAVAFGHSQPKQEAHAQGGNYPLVFVRVTANWRLC